MFDTEKLIGDCRWWANSGLVRTNCADILRQSADLMEEQQRQIQLLTVKLHQEMMQNLK
jgi:hypothetical protein